MMEKDELDFYRELSIEHQNKKILVVDDEPINLEFFEIFLSKIGFKVGIAVNGKEALEQVIAFEPDLIILDNIMPELSGLEVLKILKTDPSYAKHKDIPIIMFSLFNDMNDKIEAFELGASDWITPPFVLQEIVDRIKVSLKLSSLEKKPKNQKNNY